MSLNGVPSVWGVKLIGFLKVYCMPAYLCVWVGGTKMIDFLKVYCMPGGGVCMLRMGTVGRGVGGMELIGFLKVYCMPRGRAWMVRKALFL